MKTLPTQFYKKDENKLFGGVLSGLSDYAEINPNILRVGWAAVTIFYTIIGILAYVILFLVLPKKEHTHR
jgi:phage shock protein PspC (stress-responsive transcriptional regulator)